MAIKHASILDSLGGLACCSPTTCSVAAIFAVVLGALYVLNWPKKLNLPVVGKKGQAYYGDEVLEGVTRVRSGSSSMYSPILIANSIPIHLS